MPSGPRIARSGTGEPEGAIEIFEHFLEGAEPRRSFVVPGDAVPRGRRVILGGVVPGRDHATRPAPLGPMAQRTA